MRCELWTLSHLDTTHVILKHLAVELEFCVKELDYHANFLHKINEWKSLMPQFC